MSSLLFDLPQLARKVCIQSAHMLMELNVHILEQQFQNLETLSALDSSFKTTDLRL